jgi:hypothetical protein
VAVSQVATHALSVALIESGTAVINGRFGNLRAVVETRAIWRARRIVITSAASYAYAICFIFAGHADCGKSREYGGFDVYFDEREFALSIKRIEQLGFDLPGTQSRRCVSARSQESRSRMMKPN